MSCFYLNIADATCRMRRSIAAAADADAAAAAGCRQGGGSLHGDKFSRC